jgi:hypothetical protein
VRALAGDSGGEHDRTALPNLWASIFHCGKRRPIAQLKGTSGLLEIRGTKILHTHIGAPMSNIKETKMKVTKRIGFVT